MSIANPTPEKYLGQHISNIDSIRHLGGANPANANMYSMNGDFQFMDKAYRRIIFLTDGNGIITSVSISLWEPEVYDKGLYDSFVEKYGNPNRMYKKDETLTENSDDSTRDKDSITSTSYTYSIKDCTFEDGPLFISWKKPEYDIEVHMNRNRGYTQITFEGGLGSVEN